MAHLKIIAGPVEQRQGLLEVIGEKRHAKQIGGRALIVSTRSFGTHFVPIVDRAVAAPKPCQRNEIDLLVLVQGSHKATELLSYRIVAMILQDRNHRIIRRIGCFIRIGHHVFDIELEACESYPRLGPQLVEGELAEREAQGERHMRLFAPLAFLSLRIIAAIVDGTAPADLTVTGLARTLPYSWAEQEQRIGLSL